MLAATESTVLHCYQKLCRGILVIIMIIIFWNVCLSFICPGKSKLMVLKYEIEKISKINKKNSSIKVAGSY